jgi:hypothetical protein
MEVICLGVQQIFSEYFYGQGWTKALISDYRKSDLPVVSICRSGVGWVEPFAKPIIHRILMG